MLQLFLACSTGAPPPPVLQDPPLTESRPAAPDEEGAPGTDSPSADSEPTDPRGDTSSSQQSDQLELYRPGDAAFFAVLGDFGLEGEGAAAVSEMIHSWEPDFIITTGDNNYETGSAKTIDDNIGQYYHDYIYPYRGKYGEGADELRFLPSLGNHDWYVKKAQGYLDYFELPGGERYYHFVWGPIDFFAVDSDSHDPDGNTPDSVQAAWLKKAMQAAQQPYQIVYFHHPPYSSGRHGDDEDLQWPFVEWGADLVLSGHDHNYERLIIDDTPFVITGNGGKSLRDMRSRREGSLISYNADHGALRVEASKDWLMVESWSVDGGLVDRFGVPRGGQPESTLSLVGPDQSWRCSTSTEDSEWLSSDFDDSDWAACQLPAGLGQEGLRYELSASESPRVMVARTEFELVSGGELTGLELKLRALDGAVIYLNGEELHRIGLPKDPDASSAAMSPTLEDWQGVMVETLLPAEGLREGTNTLAVGLHQVEKSPTSLLQLELSVW